MYSIGPLTVAPGERAQGLIPVGTSSYGVELGIPLIVVNGAQHGTVLGAVDDDQRNAELHAVAAGADRDEAVGALARGDGQRTDGVHVVPSKTWIRCGTTPRRGCPR